MNFSWTSGRFLNITRQNFCVLFFCCKMIACCSYLFVIYVALLSIAETL